MARTRVRPSAARRFAGLLAVLALALCTTGLAQPAMAASMGPMEMTATVPMTPPPSPAQSDRADVEERAASSCPMDAMTMDCQLSAQYRQSSVPSAFAAHAPSPIEQDSTGLPDTPRAPPSPASREGPDLNRLCVHRT